MNTADVDIDRLVDYRSEYTQYIKKAKITGDQLIGLCPFHDDKNNSFSVNLKTGQWHCFAEDRGGNFTQFYAEVNGLDTKEAYKQILEKYGVVQEEKKGRIKAEEELHSGTIRIRKAPAGGVAERKLQTIHSKGQRR